MRTSSSRTTRAPGEGAARAEQGDVAARYLFIAALGIASVSALLGLGSALLHAEQRAKAALSSDTP